MHHVASCEGQVEIADLRFMWLEITEKCNLSCNHCYAESGPHRPLKGVMQKHDWVSVIDEAVDLGLRGIQFIGGEPTLHPDFKHFLNHAASKGLDTLEVYTNATRMDLNMVALFRELGVQVATSFYAASAPTHDSVTMRSGSWGRTVSGIERSLSAGLNVRVGVIETQHNAGHVPAAVEFLKKLGVFQIGIDGKRKVGRGQEASCHNDASDAEDFSQLCGQCWKARVCVTASAAIYPCVFSRKTVIGDARNGLLPAISSSALSRFQSIMQEEEVRRAGDCYPNLPCSPQVCSPQLQCQPQLPCAPTATCQPEYRIQPS